MHTKDDAVDSFDEGWEFLLPEEEEDASREEALRYMIRTIESL
jgi:hypothetical protein